MKIATATLLLLFIASPASAISRYQSLDRTCSAVQQLIAGEGAVLLRYPSRDGNVTLYDRYVSGDAQCSSGSYAARSSVPTKDDPNCPAYVCRSSSVFNPH
jgi:hypothetical protein